MRLSDAEVSLPDTGVQYVPDSQTLAGRVGCSCCSSPAPLRVRMCCGQRDSLWALNIALPAEGASVLPVG